MDEEDEKVYIKEINRLKMAMAFMYFAVRAGNAEDVMHIGTEILGTEYLENYGHRTGELREDESLF